MLLGFVNQLAECNDSLAFKEREKFDQGVSGRLRISKGGVAEVRGDFD